MQGMEKNKPLILISNDDGYHAKGLRSLIDMVADFGHLLVCAPESARSGFSRAFSATTPLRLKLRRQWEGVEVWSCNGTPVDCVKLALSELCGGRRPDIVIGGINHGDNASVNTHYSGTMGVTMEGCMKYIPSVAFSLCDHSDDADFAPLAPLVREITQRLLAEGLPKGVCLNVNFPTDKELKGVRVCRQAKGQWTNEWENFAHRGDTSYYWLTGEFVDSDPQDESTDHWALANGYAAITPTTVDATAYALAEEMKSWF